jgi:hypothetical protein
VRDLTLSIWAGRANIDHLVEVNARGVTTAETTLNLDILHCQLPQNTNNVRPDNGQGLATGGGHTEETLEVDRLGEILSFVGALQCCTRARDICISLLWHICLSGSLSSSPTSLDALSSCVTE